MNWFKHDTDASNDAKIKKLILKHGATGYAVYFHCLELIAGEVSEQNITFELEHDSEIIADNLKIAGTADRSARAVVEEIMLTLIQLELFEESEGHIFCLKLLRRLDSSMTSSQKLRKVVTDAKKRHDAVMITHDAVMTKPDDIMQDKIRVDKIREREAKASPHTKFNRPSVQEVSAYVVEKGFSVDAGRFCDYYESKGWVVGKSPMKDWKAAVRTWAGNEKKCAAKKITTSEFMSLSPEKQAEVRKANAI